MTKKTKTLTLTELNRQIARLFPPHLAESWDNVGLLVGDPIQKIQRVMTCLEVTRQTLDEAVERHADAIVAHHPLIFKPMRALVRSNPSQALTMDLIKAEIGLIVAHTNMDAALWGTNQVLAEMVGLKPLEPLARQPLDPGPTAANYKLVVFVPKGHESKIIDAIDRSGGGKIGLYSHCTFRAPGIGTFKGGEGSNPTIGEVGQLEQVEEFRLETLIPIRKRDAVVSAITEAHPYEEPAYDLTLVAMDGTNAGLGCIAEPAEKISLTQLVDQIKTGLKMDQVRVSGPDRMKLKKVAICTGSGGSFLGKAAARGADAYITGEMNYHSGIEAHQRSMPTIEVGHFESEQIVAPALAKKMTAMDWVQEAGVEVFAAEHDFQPFRKM